MEAAQEKEPEDPEKRVGRGRLPKIKLRPLPPPRGFAELGAGSEALARRTKWRSRLATLGLWLYPSEQQLEKSVANARERRQRKDRGRGEEAKPQDDALVDFITQQSGGTRAEAVERLQTSRIVGARRSRWSRPSRKLRKSRIIRSKRNLGEWRLKRQSGDVESDGKFGRRSSRRANISTLMTSG